MNFVFLSILFSFISFVYSIVGFGGGSSYLAILVLAGVSYEIIPVIALVCNIVVVFGSTIRFYKNKLITWKLVIPFIITSIPLSFVGGNLSLSKELFSILLGLALLTASLQMLFFNTKNIYEKINETKIWQLLLIGAFIGFFSGLVGVGGGIFLSPILYLFKWGRPKQIAAISSFFILVNSLSGLGGQLFKGEFELNLLSPYLLLVPCVWFGGQVGSFLCNKKISDKNIKKLTGLLILYVSVRLLIISI